MSTRERWIVYPILFLTFGLVFMQSLERLGGPIQFRCQAIECQHLRVETINGRPYPPPSVAIVVPKTAPPVAAEGSASDEQTPAEGTTEPSDGKP